MSRVLGTITKVMWAKDGSAKARFLYDVEGRSPKMDLSGPGIALFRELGADTKGFWDGLQVWLDRQGDNLVWDEWHEDSVIEIRKRQQELQHDAGRD